MNTNYKLRLATLDEAYVIWQIMDTCFQALEHKEYFICDDFDYVKDILSGKSPSQGASTITQQLIKNNVLTTWVGEDTFIESLQRKIQEQYLALKLEEQLQDKDFILENYLNTINLGSGC